MKFVFKKDLDAVANTKGIILMESKGICLVQTSNIFTVWSLESGFIITHTFYKNEAEEVFRKHTKGE